MKLHSINFISGFAVGVQYEDLAEDGEYVILSLGIVELIFNW